MTPAARCAAAIEIIDQILTGDAAERALTNWARRSRFAGSKDRAAIRDHVFDALRNKLSYAALGGANTGRGILLGALRAHDTSVEDIFNGVGHAPAPLTTTEVEFTPAELPDFVRLDFPEWLEPNLRNSLGDKFEAVLSLLKQRAPVYLRVNTRKSNVENAIMRLEAEGISTRPVTLTPSALKVIENPRKVANSAAYQEGIVELQDAASQFIANELEIAPGAQVLDYCAGGGGKSLAFAAKADATFFAYDIDEKRMSDIPERAKRAGVRIKCLNDEQLASEANFDVVFVDAPCSGSGSWRRSPDAKWNFTPERLQQLKSIQQDILNKAKSKTAPSGILAYATCSILSEENEHQIRDFLTENKDWVLLRQKQLTPVDGGDGFYFAELKRNA
ncbi:RsmB/NOP family class I SAM-dependent RNA methyltransferase [Cochlodiniinecator piscidefendens]|uniref:RsmB/NOP family class I SAM-dependent RNA methyltransferase n=1 Tax=Cochlodiniinecator piscidefendens TaxID=2715756 RepID=UPI001409CE84|nr:RsmB/NOP family class I SAM-dependent RNA methyltransferase [Cochlodiniinecator piscidefendens]